MGKRDAMLVFLLSSLVLVLCALPICIASAGATVAVVWTSDVTGDPKIVFDLGETVCVHWMADGGVNITVCYQDGAVDQEWLNLAASGSDSFVPGKGAGYYIINCTACAEQKMIAYGTFFVIPEILVGTFGVVVAAVASMVTLRYVGVWRRDN